MANTFIRLNTAGAMSPQIPLTRDAEAAIQGIRNVIRGMQSGTGSQYAGSISINVDGAAAQATGTVTFASAINNDTITLAGTVLTGVTGTPSTNQFKVGVSNTADAAAYAAAVNAHTTLSKYVVATSSAAVVTLTAIPYSAVGNLITLASINGTRLAVSGATLSGGVTNTAADTVYAV